MQIARPLHSNGSKAILALASAVCVFVAGAEAQDVRAAPLTPISYQLPAEAAAAGIDGKVRVGVTVEKTGLVKDPVIVGGPAWPCGAEPKKEIDEVRTAVRNLVAQTKFSPAIRGGRPDDSDLVLTFPLGPRFREAVKLADAEKAVAAGNPPPKTVDGGVLTGKAVSIPKPAYPSNAKAVKQAGIVTVEILVDAEGSVILAGALSGPELLLSTSREAACAAKFPPLVLGGTPVKVSGTVTFTFVL